MLSFIIIGKNIERTISVCIGSVLKFVQINRIKDYEIIYVDSNSSDKSIEIAMQYPVSIFLVTGQVNAAIGRNIGAINSKGTTLFFIDGDMELIPDFYDKVFTAPDRQPFYPFIRGCLHHLHYDANFQFLYKMDEPLPTTPIKSAVTGGLMIVSKNLWSKMDGMDERLVRNQDIDFGLRMTKAGFPPLLMNQYFVNHHTISYFESNRFKYFFTSKALLAPGLLMRKHFLNINFIKYSFSNYFFTMYLLFAFLCGIIDPIIGFFLLCVYAILQIYRTVRRSKKEKFVLQFFIFKFLYNFITLFALLFYYPSKNCYQTKKCK